MEAPTTIYKEVPFGYWTEWVQPAAAAIARWRRSRTRRLLREAAPEVRAEVALGIQMKFDPLARPKGAPPPILRMR